MNWGKWIVVAFVVFAGLIATLVVVSMRTDVNLVTKNYYADEIAYQAQLDRKNNTEALELKPEIALDQTYLKVYFPAVSYVEYGELKLFRPSDAGLDQQFKLSASADSVQVFKVKPLTTGSYRIKLMWAMEGKEYYLEKLISI